MLSQFILGCTLVPFLCALAMAEPATPTSPAPTTRDSARMSLARVAAKAQSDRDLMAAVELVAAEPNALVGTLAFGDLMHDAYWNKKDLPLAVAYGRAGAQHGLSAAARLPKGESTKAEELRSAAKAFCYDLASFTWDGWDEKAITITPADRKIGLDAAKTNLRLAEELHKDELALGRAWWMLAGQQLSAGDHKSARSSYETAATHSAAAKNADEALLSKAFVILVDILESPDKPELRQQLDQAKAQFSKTDDGREFSRQVDSALRVFSRAGK